MNGRAPSRSPPSYTYQTTHTSLSQLALGPSDFTAIAQRLKAAFGPDKIMFGLEGGYDPALITEAVKATLAPFLPAAAGSSDTAGGGGAVAAAAST